MRKLLLLFCLSLFCNSLIAQDTGPAGSEKKKPDTVTVGVYITSIHDIDFKQKEYFVNLWAWFRYKKENAAFDFAHNLEIPNAKTFTTSYLTVDSSGDDIYMLMKLQCEMKDNWKIANFPFDRQKLRLSIENSLYDANSLVFKVDTAGDHYDRRYAISGWKIIPDSFQMVAENRIYKTAFGDKYAKKPEAKYHAFKIRIGIERDATGLFWKMFLGMYIAFLIAYVCFYIHSDGMDSRFGLSVGSLFAVIGNKYIVDSSLPESTSFTLVDTLHGLTLFSIFVVIGATAFSLRLVKQDKLRQSRRFDMIVAQSLLALYVILNIIFIYQAAN
ncbi:MAG: hypothetical protein IPP31_12320 [Chitinophagaceae bacterium]|nr:hypothetical protein [Chitinophagaceae bacterium]